VTESDGVAGAVLIRAAEPLAGVEGSDPRPLSGPGKLCAGLGITRADNGTDLTAPGAFFAADFGHPPPAAAVSKRIGVEYAGRWADRLLRFYERGNSYVSGRPR
jgi:DNA-3-methyladenine glycosylase